MLLALGIGGCVVVGVLFAIGEAVDAAQSWKYRQTLKGLTDEEATAYRNQLANEAEAKRQEERERRTERQTRRQIMDSAGTWKRRQMIRGFPQDEQIRILEALDKEAREKAERQKDAR